MAKLTWQLLDFDTQITPHFNSKRKIPLNWIEYIQIQAFYCVHIVHTYTKDTDMYTQDTDTYPQDTDTYAQDTDTYTQDTDVKQIQS